MTIRNTMKRAAAAAMLAGLAVVFAAVPAQAQSRTGSAAAKAETSEAKLDVIIFRNGQKVECEILEETDSTVKVKIAVAGMVAETVYQKSEILAIQKGAGAPVSTAGKPAPRSTTTGRKPDAKPEQIATDGVPTVYVIRCTGEFGRDVSATPFAQVIEDVKKHQPDILVMEFDHVFGQYGEEVPDYLYQPGSFDQLETARQLSTLLTDRIRDDGDWPKKPRLVGYIKKAMGAACFLPFVCPELYFHPDGLHGGVGGLEHMFDGVGDKVAQEKQYSLRLKRAEGLAEKGGHEPRILRAMARMDFVLSYRMVGGKAEFLERMPETADEFLLADDGEGDRRDGAQERLRYLGNDVLTLNAVTAEKIGLSRGTVANLSELMYAMGYTREFTEVKGRSADILKRWSDDVNRAEANLQRLIRQFQNVEVRAPGQYRERTAARTQQKSILREARGIFMRYKEALNPRRFPADAAINDIDVIIDQIDQQQRLDGPP
ncbi:MAG: hypothetical protein KF699_11175 [Phycisphaeraceae bacterium]|nr:hypothetical protein [Phycisphaeraceae bacterium]